VGSSSESGQAAGQAGTVATKTRVSTQFDDDDLDIPDFLK
jgi:hypothetical protein